MKLWSRIQAWLAEGQDEAWKPSQVRQTFGTYDEAKAVAGYKRSRKQSATGRVYARKMNERAPEPTVRPFKVVR